MIKRTTIKLKRKTFSIKYEKKDTPDGRLFQGNIFFGKKAFAFCFLKFDKTLISFEPETTDENKLIILNAVESNEKISL